MLEEDGEEAAAPTGSAEAVVVGDYRLSNSPPDGDGVEGVLRVRTGGQWWHAVHRCAEERGRVADSRAKGSQPPQQPTSVWKAYKEFGRGQEAGMGPPADLGGEYEVVSIWEIAECLGSWQVERVPADGGGSCTVLQLTCESWSWKCSHATAPSAFQPTEQGRTELDALVEAGQLVLCYAVCADQQQGARLLELQPTQMPRAQPAVPAEQQQQLQGRHARLRSLQTAFQTLGFARSYTAPQLSSSSGSCAAVADEDDEHP